MHNRRNLRIKRGAKISPIIFSTQIHKDAGSGRNFFSPPRYENFHLYSLTVDLLFNYGKAPLTAVIICNMYIKISVVDVVRTDTLPDTLVFYIRSQIIDI